MTQTPLAPARQRARPAVGADRRRPLSRTLRAYVALTKPRIIELLLVTTLPAMVLAADGLPRLTVVLATMVGGTLAAGSANALNCFLDRDIDAVMRRTGHRPLARHQVSPAGALAFGAALGAVAVLLIGLATNWLAGALTAAAIGFYVVVYTMLLKRRTAQNIVWGGAAGCMPVLIGWAAVTGSLAWPPVVLFAVVFCWTPPHYWPLSMRFKQDYAEAHVPMLPVVERLVVVARQIAIYAWAMVLASLALIPVAGMGWIYTVVAIASGGIFLAESHRLLSGARAGIPELKLRPMRLFHLSITYLTILFVGVALDPIWHLPLPGLG